MGDETDETTFKYKAEQQQPFGDLGLRVFSLLFLFVLFHADLTWRFSKVLPKLGSRGEGENVLVDGEETARISLMSI